MWNELQELLYLFCQKDQETELCASKIAMPCKSKKCIKALEIPQIHVNIGWTYPLPAGLTFDPFVH